MNDDGMGCFSVIVFAFMLVFAVSLFSDSAEETAQKKQAAFEKIRPDLELVDFKTTKTKGRSYHYDVTGRLINKSKCVPKDLKIMAFMKDCTDLGDSCVIVGESSIRLPIVPQNQARDFTGTLNFSDSIIIKGNRYLLTKLSYSNLRSACLD